MTDFFAFTIVGVVTGAIFAVAASGLVLTYTTSGIFNFAHGAIGMIMAFLYWELRFHRGWPTPIVLIVVLLIAAPLLGVLIERVFVRGLYGAPVGVTIVVTLALLVLLLGIGQIIWDPGETRRMEEFFAGRGFRMAGVFVTYHSVVTLLVAGAIAGGLRFLLYHTRIGVTMRAVVDDRDLTALNGAYPERVSMASWALGAILASVAGILIAPAISLNHLLLTLLVINGYAAAMVGRLRSLPLTFLGALILGLLDAYAIGYLSRFAFLGNMKPIIPTLFLFAVLIFLPQARLRAGRLTAIRAPRVPTLQQSLRRGAVFLVVVALLSTQLSEFWLFNFSTVLIMGIVLLSLVLLTGYAGQISLMQMAFVGVGALMMGRLGGDGTLIGLVIAGVGAALLGALVALPALRVRDLYLALATLAMALLAEWGFNQTWVFGRGGILEVPRVSLGLFAFDTERSQLILAAIAFTGFGILVLAVRRSGYGRRLSAMRDSPIACTTLGMNLIGAKTTIFALSAGVAGVAGALFGGLRTTVSVFDFLMLQSLFLFLIATIGGINTVTGALLGAAFLSLFPQLEPHLPIENGLFLGAGLGAIAVAKNPNGVAGDLAHLGDLFRFLGGRWKMMRTGGAPAEAETPPAEDEKAAVR